MSRFRTLASLALFVVAGMTGCVVEVPGGNNNNNNNNNSNPGGDPERIRVRVVNLTGATIDPEIFLTNAAVTDPAQLFVADRKYTAYGVGNRGLLGDFDSDEFSLECSAVRVLGTKGGLFGDNLDAPDGVGQQRILSQGVSIACGDVATFTYSRSGSTFSTTVTVSR